MMDPSTLRQAVPETVEGSIVYGPSSMIDDAFQEGIRLFNEGHYWHAHEQWEACWLHADEPDATFYKGLIQAAAALVHWQRHNPRGLQRNWFKGRPRIVALTPHYRTIDLDQLLVEMDRFVLTIGDSAVPRIRCVSLMPDA